MTKLLDSKDKVLTLGDNLKDSITGFSGILIAYTTWLNGCVRVGIQTRGLKDGKPVNTQWFDIEQVVRTGTSLSPIKRVAPSGGPKSDPSRR